MRTIDLNADLGESFGQYTFGNDEGILDIVTSASIACGYHAGDHNVMAETVAQAARKNVAIGAHPGFDDLRGFGRRYIQTTPTDIYNAVVYQIGALHGFCRLHGVRMQHVKPHGALYNIACQDQLYARAIAQAVCDVDPQLTVFGLAGSILLSCANQLGLATAQEVFADRTYQPDGTLTPRSQPDAVLHDVESVVQQTISIVAQGLVTTVQGTTLPLTADTICVHGDTPGALELARRLQAALQTRGIVLQAAGCTEEPDS